VVYLIAGYPALSSDDAGFFLFKDVMTSDYRRKTKQAFR